MKVHSFSNSYLEIVMAGKGNRFQEAETQNSQHDLESSPLSCTAMPPDSQVDESQATQPDDSLFDHEDSQGDSGLSQDTLRLSPNVHQFSPKPLPSPDQPEESPTEEEEKEEENPEEDGESEDSGRLTPPLGFVLSSDGMIHGDASVAHNNPMLAMIMASLGNVMARKLAEQQEDAAMEEGKGKGKVGKGNGYESVPMPEASSSSVAPKSKPKAKSKAIPFMKKRGKYGKKN